RIDGWSNQGFVPRCGVLQNLPQACPILLHSLRVSAHQELDRIRVDAILIKGRGRQHFETRRRIKLRHFCDDVRPLIYLAGREGYRAERSAEWIANDDCLPVQIGHGLIEPLREIRSREVRSEENVRTYGRLQIRCGNVTGYPQPIFQSEGGSLKVRASVLTNIAANAPLTNLRFK